MLPNLKLLALLHLVGADTLWEGAWSKHEGHIARDPSNFDYFVARAPDPAEINADLIEPMPIPDHWVFAINKHDVRKRDVLSDRRVYPGGTSVLQKRAPVGAAQGSCVPRKLSKREETLVDDVKEEFGIKDPLFSKQWHLYDPTNRHDINVTGAWRLGARGKDVVVAVLDDGIDYNHPDLADAFFMSGSYDYNLHVQEPKPLLMDDWHGTRCAGEIAAQFNDACGVGIAPAAKVAGIRILSGHLEVEDEARALNHHIQENDIFSCSWGPSDDGTHMEGPPLISKRAILNAVENGRAGLGTIYVLAAGNGNHNGDNCNYDGYTNSIYSLTISSVDEDNMHPFYSESCPANIACTYSSNSKKKITTTDRFDDRSSSDAKQACTDAHTGTSASAPMAAGILALALGERPDLTWRDLQYIAREAAVPFEMADAESRGNWTEVHDGKLYHNDYGYGILDAGRVVEVAKGWKNVKPQAWFFSEFNAPNDSFTDKYETQIEVTQDMLDGANLEKLEHVNVKLSYQYEFRGALKWTLTSPSGHEVVLAERRRNDRASFPVDDWQFLSVAHWGEDPVGTWTLKVDADPVSSGEFKRWRLQLWGQTQDESKARRFSEVFDENTGKIPDDVVNSVLEPSNTATPPSPPTKTGSSSTKKPHPPTESSEHEPHGILFYLACSFAGVTLIMLVAVPVGLWALRRRAQNTGVTDVSNYGLLDRDLDFTDDELNDSFDLDDPLPSDDERGERTRSENNSHSFEDEPVEIGESDVELHEVSPEGDERRPLRDNQS